MSSATSVFSMAELGARVGASEPAIRLIITILAGYPLAAVYRISLKDERPIIKHLYFALTGFSLFVFNFGFAVIHSIISICISYLFAKLMYKSKHLVTVNFIFHMGYLLVGYYLNETNDYDIKWTLPHCILTLRLIGLAYDIADGRLPEDQLSKDQKENALQRLPSLLEVIAFTYFPPSFLVGPQFPLRRYQRFTNNEFNQYKGSTQAGLTRLGLGLIYLAIHHIGSLMLPDDYLLTPEFAQYSFLRKIIILGIWGKVSLYKYISCWLLGEGALICCGLTYVGTSEDGTEDWSACTSVKLSIFENMSRMQHYIPSFNVNTNRWLGHYVYKRLRFLGNRDLSQAGALFFLALWHGFHSGYYAAFALEFFVLAFEKQFESVYMELQAKYPVLNTPETKQILYIIGRIYTFIFSGYCVIPFFFRNFTRWFKVCSVFNYFVEVILLAWFTGYFLFKIISGKFKQS